MSAAKPVHHTLSDWLAVQEHDRVELIDGDLVRKAAPDPVHGFAQLKVGGLIDADYGRPPGGKRPGGWWLMTEVDVRLQDNVFRPDLAGWRMERSPSLPEGRPVLLRPDWLCEVVSPSNATQDTVTKMNKYHSAGVPHYWVLDPRGQSLAVYRHSAAGYVAVVNAKAGDKVRAEPFEEVELELSQLFGGVS